ncbi:MAG: glycosyltransferase family 2 protein [Bacteroidota bacterium]
MKVLAIVVSYNGMQWYDRCFSSLQASTLPIDVFVVDNASSDNSAAFIKTNFPMIHLIESPVNLGFGHANNKGMRYALDNGYDYVFLLNQDAWLVQTNTIEQLIKGHTNHPKYGIISPMHLYGSGEKVSKGMIMDLVSHNHSTYDLLSDLYFNRVLNEIYLVDYVCAAAWLIPCSVLKTVGGFDPIFFHYGEDDNYMQRLVYHGFSIGICPKVSICHDMEFRGGDYGKENNNWKKSMMVEFADVNKPLIINKIKLKYISKAMQQVLFLRLSHAITNYKVALFIQKNYKSIANSYNKNRTKASNWI